MSDCLLDDTRGTASHSTGAIAWPSATVGVSQRRWCHSLASTVAIAPDRQGPIGSATWIRRYPERRTWGC